jgi:pilus assembly protein CpaB
VLGAVAAILLAAVGTFVLVAYVRGAEERALEGEQGVSVLVVSEPIEKGTPVSDIADRVTSELVPAKVQTAGTVEDLSALEGTVAAVDLLPGDQIVASRFIAPSAFQAARPVEVPEGLLEVTVSLNPERAFGGQVSPGDTVAVVASFDPFQLDGLEPSFLEPGQDGAALTEVSTEDDERTVRSSPNTSHILLHKVLVTNVQVEQLPVTPEDQGNEEGTPTYTPDLAPTGNLLISLALTAPDIERMVFTAEFGNIWLAREPANAAEGNTYIQTRGSVYLPTEGLVPVAR